MYKIFGNSIGAAQSDQPNPLAISPFYKRRTLLDLTFSSHTLQATYLELKPCIGKKAQARVSAVIGRRKKEREKATCCVSET